MWCLKQMEHRMQYNLTVSAQDLQVISNALGLRPYAEVAHVIARLQVQVNQQEKTAPGTSTIDGAPPE